MGTFLSQEDEIGVEPACHIRALRRVKRKSPFGHAFRPTDTRQPRDIGRTAHIPTPPSTDPSLGAGSAKRRTGAQRGICDLSPNELNGSGGAMSGQSCGAQEPPVTRLRARPHQLLGIRFLYPRWPLWRELRLLLQILHEPLDLVLLWSDPLTSLDSGGKVKPRDGDL
jgi:hypothetical protein